ncbi:MAG: hypothetical protein M3O22_07600 [Pseudomonadota bacterium]|nr:hypothetical protein [Pseudomonadota bacterium]
MKQSLSKKLALAGLLGTLVTGDAQAADPQVKTVTVPFGTFNIPVGQQTQPVAINPCAQYNYVYFRVNGSDVGKLALFKTEEFNGSFQDHYSGQALVYIPEASRQGIEKKKLSFAELARQHGNATLGYRSFVNKNGLVEICAVVTQVGEYKLYTTKDQRHTWQVQGLRQPVSPYRLCTNNLSGPDIMPVAEGFRQAINQASKTIKCG